MGLASKDKVRLPLWDKGRGHPGPPEPLEPHASSPLPPAGVFREATTEFSVDARALTKTGGPHVKARVANPSGNLTETFVQDCGDGTYKVEYTPYEEGMSWGSQGMGDGDSADWAPPYLACLCPGLHSVDVTYDGSPVPSSPFQVPVTEGCDPSRVRVHGPGIQSGTTNKPNKFTVETR